MKKFYCALLTILMIGLFAGGAMAQGQLFLYNWTDFTSPDLIKKFEKETGIKVTLDTFDSNETLLAKLQAGGGGYDIVCITHNYVPIHMQEGLLQKINALQLKGYDNIIDSLKSPPWDPGNLYTVPFQHGTTSFSVNTDVYKGDINTLKILFEPPPELQGKIAMFNSPDEVIPMALIYLGYELCNENPKEMKEVQDLLLKQKPHVKVYSTDGILERLISGDVAIHMNWNGYAMRTRQKNPSIKYAYPVEGITSWVENMAVPKDAKNRENAIKFIEFMLQPENAALESNFARYANGIKGSTEFMDEDLRSAPELFVPEGVKTIFTATCSEKSIKLTDKVWTKLMQ